MKSLALLVALVFAATAALACPTHRDRNARAAFQRQHPCPANGATRGACPGYVVDHVKPLCAGGADKPTNMQWQTHADSKRKDVEEDKLCRKLR